MKEYEILFKFGDVVRTIEAENQQKALEIAQEMLGNEPIGHDTFCYDVEAEEVEQ